MMKVSPVGRKWKTALMISGYIIAVVARHRQIALIA